MWGSKHNLPFLSTDSVFLDSININKNSPESLKCKKEINFLCVQCVLREVWVHTLQSTVFCHFAHPWCLFRRLCATRETSPWHHWWSLFEMSYPSGHSDKREGAISYWGIIIRLTWACQWGIFLIGLWQVKIQPLWEVLLLDRWARVIQEGSLSERTTQWKAPPRSPLQVLLPGSCPEFLNMATSAPHNGLKPTTQIKSFLNKLVWINVFSQ